MMDWLDDLEKTLAMAMKIAYNGGEYLVLLQVIMSHKPNILTCICVISGSHSVQRTTFDTVTLSLFEIWLANLFFAEISGTPSLFIIRTTA